MLDYYYKIVDINNYIYSIDMVRINFELFEKKYNIVDFCNLIERYSYKDGVEVKRFISKSGLNYHYMYNLTFFENDKKCSFAIGLGLLSKKENMDKGFIEFNPNKCNFIKIFRCFYLDFKKMCYSFNVKRYDLAIDIPGKRDLFKMVTSSKCMYQAYVEGKSYNSSMTEYQGRRNHNKFTKLYDKTKESKLSFDLTRLEFTFDINEVKFENLPQILFLDSIDLLKKEEIFLQLLINSEDINFYLKKLDYRKRKRIKEDLKSYFIKINYSYLHKIREIVLNYNFNLGLL